MKSEAWVEFIKQIKALIVMIIMIQQIIAIGKNETMTTIMF